MSQASDTLRGMNQFIPLELDLAMRLALESFDAAGLEYTIVCAGDQILCPGWSAAAAA